MHGTDEHDADEVVMEPTHPGALLLEEFLEPLGVSEYRLAQDIGVPQTRISAITKGRRRISADTGLRLSRYFGMSEGFWVGLQASYDREIAKDRIKDTLASIRPLSAA